MILQMPFVFHPILLSWRVGSLSNPTESTVVKIESTMGSKVVLRRTWWLLLLYRNFLPTEFLRRIVKKSKVAIGWASKCVRVVWFATAGAD